MVNSDQDDVDPDHRLQYFRLEDYQKLIFDTSLGKYVGAGENGETEWMIFFVEYDKTWTAMFKIALKKLAKHYQGKVKFAVIDPRLEETITLAYEVYQSPKGFFIDK